MQFLRPAVWLGFLSYQAGNIKLSTIQHPWIKPSTTELKYTGFETQK